MPDDTPDTDTTSADDQFPTDRNSAVFGKVGTGKTQQLRAELARRVADDTESVEFTDPKGEGEENGG